MFQPVPLAARSQWARKLADGVFLRSVEVVPPRGWDPSAMLEQCRALRDAGVDAVNLVDGSRAQSRMGVVPAGVLAEFFGPEFVVILLASIVAFPHRPQLDEAKTWRVSFSKSTLDLAERTTLTTFPRRSYHARRPF